MHKLQVLRSGFGLLALVGAISIASCTREDVRPGGCAQHSAPTTPPTPTDTTTTVTTDTTATRIGN